MKPPTPYADAEAAIGSLAMSVVRPGSAAASARARTWYRDLDTLGVHAPFAVVHDIGAVFAFPQGAYVLAPRTDLGALVGRAPGTIDAARTYRTLIEEIAASDACRRAVETKMSDAAITAVLARLLDPIGRTIATRRAYGGAIAAEASGFEMSELELAARWVRVDRRFELAWLDALAAARLLVLTLVDGIDVDVLRLVGVLGDSSAATALAEMDLLKTLESPTAHDVVAFSLELVPSVLETKVRPGAAVHPAAGYSGIGRRGSIDSLMLTELAWDDDEFVRRLMDDEVLYFSRDEAPDERRRSHCLVIDASASMRGERSTFARALALATAKRLVTLGEDVSFRFFDARLYEVVRAKGRELPTSYVLSFEGERGRNPRRVFSALAHDVALQRLRERTDVTLHLFTHGSFDIPRDVVSALRAEARLEGVFIAPRGEVELGYLDLLDAHWVVRASDLTARRGETARAILGVEGA